MKESLHYGHRDCSQPLSAYQQGRWHRLQRPGRAYATSFHLARQLRRASGETKQSGERTPRTAQRGICQFTHWC